MADKKENLVPWRDRMKSSRFFLLATVGILAVSLFSCAGASKRTAMDDQTIANQIKAQLEAPTGPDGPFSIDISVKKGAVSLDGTVVNAGVKDRALEIAQTTAGVKDVKSFLVVK